MENRKESDNILIKSNKKKSLLKFLSKKSIKIEPEIFNNENNLIPSNGRLNNLNEFRVPSTNNLLNENDEENLCSESTVHNYASSSAIVTVKNSSKTNEKTFNNNSRFSNQFAFCCSSNHKSLTPPNLPRQSIEEIKECNDILENSSTTLNYTKPTGILDEYDRYKNSPKRVRPLSFVEEENNRIEDIETISRPITPTFVEYRPSIAMQSCRSRLRQKLLPPGTKFDFNETNVQHFSSPDISEQLTERPENRSNSLVTLHGTTSLYGNTITGTGSLAKQALMATEVLHLIPTERARERSYLAGRLASVSLLGKWQLEHVIPTKELKIFVGSWNMNGQNPPKQMNDFVLPLGVEHVPDIVTIGTQESSSERFEWEVILQETLGPSHILLHSTSLGTLHLAVFIRRDLIWYCPVPEGACLSVRPGSAFRTKGAIAISFCVFGTSFLFVTSHLTAHQQKVKERVQDIRKIINALDLPRNLPGKRSQDVTQNFDSVYWCGDLNFRLAEPRDKLLRWIETTKFPLPSHLPHGYMHTDQLQSVLSDGAAFKGFHEANITFPPTYKYDPGTQQFDTSSKQRAPAYTDRILYKFRSKYSRRSSGALTGTNQPPSPVECIAYDSVPSIVTSDHKPVWGLFRNVVQPGVDTIPLAAGLFNREVYLEGMRRRLNNNDSGSSAVCSIQ